MIHAIYDYYLTNAYAKPASPLAYVLPFPNINTKGKTY